MLQRTLEPERMDSQEEAAEYDQMQMHSVNVCFVEDLLNFGCPDEGLVVDVGAGNGLILCELLSRRPKLYAAAVDASAEMLRCARRRLTDAGVIDRVTFFEIDAREAVLENGRADLVISNSLIHHIPAPAEVLAPTARMLKPGGRLFVRDLMRPGSVQQVTHLVNEHAGEESDEGRELFRRSLHAALTVPEAQALAESVGLQAAATQTSDRHWTMTAIGE